MWVQTDACIGSTYGRTCTTSSPSTGPVLATLALTVSSPLVVLYSVVTDPCEYLTDMRTCSSSQPASHGRGRGGLGVVNRPIGRVLGTDARTCLIGIQSLNCRPPQSMRATKDRIGGRAASALFTACLPADATKEIQSERTQTSYMISRSQNGDACTSGRRSEPFALRTHTHTYTHTHTHTHTRTHTHNDDDDNNTNQIRSPGSSECLHLLQYHRMQHIYAYVRRSKSKTGRRLRLTTRARYEPTPTSKFMFMMLVSYCWFITSAQLCRYTVTGIRPLGLTVPNNTSATPEPAACPPYGAYLHVVVVENSLSLLFAASKYMLYGRSESASQHFSQSPTSTRAQRPFCTRRALPYCNIIHTHRMDEAADTTSSPRSTPPAATTTMTRWLLLSFVATCFTIRFTSSTCTGGSVMFTRSRPSPSAVPRPTTSTVVCAREAALTAACSAASAGVPGPQHTGS